MQEKTLGLPATAPRYMRLGASLHLAFSSHLKSKINK